MGAFFWPFGANSKNNQFLGAWNWKLGGKNFPQNDLAPLLDSEFNLDYDFAVKQDPFQSDDRVMDLLLYLK